MYEVCPMCSGRGDIKAGNARQPCPQCNGTGVIGTSGDPPDALPGREHEAMSRRISSRTLPLWLLALSSLLSALVLIWALFARQQVIVSSISITNANANGNTNVNNNAASATPLNTPPKTGASGQTPHPGSPVSGGSATPVPRGGTPPPTPLPTPLSQVTPPMLFVSSQMMHLTLCVAGSDSFVVGNHGGGTLRWLIKASNTLYSVSPQQGSLDAEHTQSVQVSDITLNGSIDVSSNGGGATIVVTCG